MLNIFLDFFSVAILSGSERLSLAINLLGKYYGLIELEQMYFIAGDSCTYSLKELFLRFE